MKYNIDKLFPLTSDYSKLQFDQEGLYSITNHVEAYIISNIILSNFINNLQLNIIDCTAGIGGNTISFCKFFNKVTSIEINEKRFIILKNNINIYLNEKKNNIKLLNMNCIEYIKENKNNYNIFFFDPPWGGPEYKKKKKIRLNLDIYTLKNIVDLLINKEKIIVFKLPFNYDFSEFSDYNYKLYKIKNYYIILI